MLKIGDFSKAARVTVKTLRYYDEIGLLVPDFVNPENGYRYYSPGKLAVVAEIQAMKDVGLYLEDIQMALKKKLTPQQRLELLQSRRESLIEELLSGKNTLQKLDRMIQSINKEHTMENITIKQLPEVIAATYRTVIPSYQALFTVVPRMGEIMRAQGAVCREPAYCFNIYHDGEYREKDIDVEICEAVTEYCAESDGVVYKKIAGIATAATILHRGPYETLGKSYAALFAWIEEHDFEAVENPRESYIDGIWNRENPEDWLTEIQIPVTKQ